MMGILKGVVFLKLDLHCHTKVGSIDSKISLEDYIRCLKEQGFDGMMITDHTSSKGWKVWDEIKNEEEFKDFVVIKGNEYDTSDAGHFIVVLPDDVNLKVLNIRGMKLKQLIKVVHSVGGILGPAHPYGVKTSSAMHLKGVRLNPGFIKKFDFVEVFNTCETPESNVKARKFAEKHKLVGIAGTDSHKEDYVGMAHTEINADIKNNNDFINSIKERKVIEATGIEREPTRAMAMKMHWSGVYAFKVYNTGLGLLFAPFRRYHYQLQVQVA